MLAFHQFLARIEVHLARWTPLDRTHFVDHSVHLWVHSDDLLHCAHMD